MSEAQTPSRSLPPHPNAEYLRKHAKRLARDEAIQLAVVQRRLAHEYGCRTWAELMIEVERRASSIGDGGDDSSATPPGSDQTAKTRGRFSFPGAARPRGVPHVSYPIFVGRPTSIKAVLHAKERNVPIVLATQKDMEISNPSSSNMYEVGTIGRMIDVIHPPMEP